MKKAVKTAQKNHGLGVFLNYLFQKTFAVAKEVRSKTEIGAHSVSLAAAGVRVASSIFGSLENSNILFVGAGEMIELCAAISVRKNRKTLPSQTAPSPELRLWPKRSAQKLSDSSTSRKFFGVRHSDHLHGQHASHHRSRHGSKCTEAPQASSDLHDHLAVPRDIEREVDDLDEVYVYTVDDLGKVVQSGIQGRKAPSSRQTDSSKPKSMNLSAG